MAFSCSAWIILEVAFAVHCHGALSAAHNSCTTRGIVCSFGHEHTQCQVLWSWEKSTDCSSPPCRFFQYESVAPPESCKTRTSMTLQFHRRSLKQALAPFQAPPFVQVPAPMPAPAPVVLSPLAPPTSTTTNPGGFPFNPCVPNNNVGLFPGLPAGFINCFAFPFGQQQQQQPQQGSVASPAPSPS